MKKLRIKPRAIIFDMDGVIVDSMPYHFIAWYEALRPWGVRVSSFEVYSKEGERWDKTLKILLKRAKIKPDRRILEEIFGHRKKIFRRYFKRFIFKGAEELLRRLHKRGYLLGLVTGTPDKEIRKILPFALRKLFHSVVAGNDVKKGKPHPEPYLKAALALRVLPSECLVIENAPYGIESAKRAGMTCIAVTTSLPKEYLKQADMQIEDLGEIYRILL